MASRPDSSGVFVILMLIVIGYLVLHNNESTSSTFLSTATTGDTDDDQETLTRREAIDQYWDDIRDYMDGSESISACSPTGTCYDAEADISNGTVDRIVFPTGHSLMFSADIEGDGSASDSDSDGNPWSFDFDMNSSLVDDAIAPWADATDHK